MAEPEQFAHVVQALRRRFAEHNRRVLLLTLLIFLIAAGLWTVVYAVLYWLVLLARSAVQGVEAQPPETFPAVFIYGAGLLMLVAWLVRRASPDRRPRDEKSAGEIIADCVFALPGATLAIWGNLSAWQHLSRAELEQAALLVLRLAEGRIPVHSLPVEIPDRAIRRKVVFALHWLQVIELRRDGETHWLSLSPVAATMLAR